MKRVGVGNKVDFVVMEDSKGSMSPQGYEKSTFAVTKIPELSHEYL